MKDLKSLSILTYPTNHASKIDIFFTAFLLNADGCMLIEQRIFFGQ